VGVSLGGMIAQTMAIKHPHRIHSLISIMSSPWSGIGAPTEAVQAALPARHRHPSWGGGVALSQRGADTALGAVRRGNEEGRAARAADRTRPWERGDLRRCRTSRGASTRRPTTGGIRNGGSDVPGTSATTTCSASTSAATRWATRTRRDWTDYLAARTEQHHRDESDTTGIRALRQVPPAYPPCTPRPSWVKLIIVS
jgi:hypothetical protein